MSEDTPSPVLKIETAEDDGYTEQVFTCAVRFKPGSEELPVFSFIPSDGMTPLDCIAMCAQGQLWALEAIEFGKRQAPQPNREQRRAAQKQKSRPTIWTPGSA